MSDIKPTNAAREFSFTVHRNDRIPLTWEDLMLWIRSGMHEYTFSGEVVSEWPDDVELIGPGSLYLDFGEQKYEAEGFASIDVTGEKPHIVMYYKNFTRISE